MPSKAAAAKPGRRAADNLMTREEARRIAIKVETAGASKATVILSILGEPS